MLDAPAQPVHSHPAQPHDQAPVADTLPIEVDADTEAVELDHGYHDLATQRNAGLGSFVPEPLAEPHGEPAHAVADAPTEAAVTEAADTQAAGTGVSIIDVPSVEIPHVAVPSIVVPPVALPIVVQEPKVPAAPPLGLLSPQPETPSSETPAPETPAPETPAPETPVPEAPVSEMPAAVEPHAPQLAPADHPAAPTDPAAEHPVPTQDAAPVLPAAAPLPTPVAGGVSLRLNVPLAALTLAQRQLEEALGEPVPLSLLLGRAAARSLHLLELPQGVAVTLADAHGHALRAPLTGEFRASLAGLSQPGEAAQGLLVLDAAALDLDELHLGEYSLSLGRSQEGRAALSLRGNVDAPRAARFLHAVAALLETPIKLLV